MALQCHTAPAAFFSFCRRLLEQYHFRGELRSFLVDSQKPHDHDEEDEVEDDKKKRVELEESFGGIDWKRWRVEEEKLEETLAGEHREII